MHQAGPGRRRGSAAQVLRERRGHKPVPVALPIDALGPAPRAELLHVLMLPDFERADRIGEFWGYPESRAFAELLIDCRWTGRWGPSLSGCSMRPSTRSRSPAISLGHHPSGQRAPSAAGVPAPNDVAIQEETLYFDATYDVVGGARLRGDQKVRTPGRRKRVLPWDG
jgi:hypothetical protein